MRLCLRAIVILLASLLLPLFVYAQTDSLEPYLNMSLDSLLKIKVSTAGKQEQQISDIPASIYVINRSEIESSGYKDLNEIIENIPGFYNLGNAYFEGGTNFGIRGFSSGGALADFMIMVNGISQVQDFSNSFSTDKIIVPVEAIDRIEIVRGPNAVIYGSSAFMGAINIITNDEFKKNKSTASLSGGSNETYKAVVHITAKRDNLSLVFNGSIAKTNGLNVKFSDLQSDSNIIKSWGLLPDATTNGFYAGESKYFELSAKYKNFSFMINSVDNNLGTPGSKPAYYLTDAYTLKTSNSTVFAGYEKQFGKQITINAKINYFNYDQFGNTHFNYANSFNIIHTISKGYEIELSTLVKFLQYSDFIVGINNKTTLEAWRLIDLSTAPISFRNFSYFADEKNNPATNSIFAQLNLRPTEKLLFVAGLRVEKSSSFDLFAQYDYTKYPVTNTDTTILIKLGTISFDKILLIPRLALIYKFNDHNIIKLMFGQSKKKPSILEEVNIGARNLNGLNFASMQTIEVNYSTKIGNHNFFTLCIFNNKLDNLVLRNNEVLPNGNIITRTSNAGTMTTTGVSLNVKVKPIKNLLLEMETSYQSTTNLTDGYPETASYAPNFLGYFNIIYSINKLSFCVYGNYVDKMEPGWNINADTALSSWYGLEVPAYLKLNLNIRANDIWRGLFVSSSVTNILNTQIHYPTTPNSTWTDKGMLGLGRFLEIKIGYKF